MVKVGILNLIVGRSVAGVELLLLLRDGKAMYIFLSCAATFLVLLIFYFIFIFLCAQLIIYLFELEIMSRSLSLYRY